MSLITSETVKQKEAIPLSDKTAKEDIVVENINGQQVVVVHAGQQVPEDLDAAKERAQQGPIEQAEEKAVDKPAENKARSSSKKKGG